MTTLTYPTAAALDALPQPAAKRPSFWRRLVEAMMESRRRRAEIEIRRVLAMLGEPRPSQDDALLPFQGE